MKNILRLLTGFLFMGTIYGYFILQQSTEPGTDRYLPIIAMAFGACVCGVLSLGGRSKFDTTDKRWPLWKIWVLAFLGLGLAAYYFFFAYKP